MRETQGALGPSRRKVDRFFEHPGFEVRLVVLACFIGALEWHQHEAIYMHIHMYMYIHTRLGRPRYVVYTQRDTATSILFTDASLSPAAHLEVCGQKER